MKVGRSKGCVSPNKGKKYPYKARPKMLGKRWKQDPSKIYSGENASHWKGGKPKCLDCSKQTSNYDKRRCFECSIKIRSGKNHHWYGRRLLGEKSPVWIADRTKLKQFGDANLDRRSSAYVTWRKEVWKRDNFKCKIANTDCAGRIEAHHILSWSEYVELRYLTNNGITLCHAHHPKKRSEEKRLQSEFQALVSVPKTTF